MSKVKVVVGLRVEVDPPWHVTSHSHSSEEKQRRLNAWAREFEAFVRDHRSQDPISLNVIRDERDQCSHCGYEWEQDADGPLCCDKAQAEWNAAREKAA